MNPLIATPVALALFLFAPSLFAVVLGSWIIFAAASWVAEKRCS